MLRPDEQTVPVVSSHSTQRSAVRASSGALFVLRVIALVAVLGSRAGSGENRSINQQIDRVMARGSEPGDPGFAVLVKQGPKIVFERGYGVREFGKPAKITPDTNFRLASLTKQFTAMATMLLVHDGKLHYEDRLSDIWPDFPAYGRAITVYQLLTHTSGLPDYETLMEAEEKAHGPRWSAENQIQDPEVLALLKAQTSGVFPPETKWEYSNSGYVILGMIVAKVSGMSYGEFLEKRIFRPLGMRTTIVYGKGKNQVANRAYGYTREDGTFKPTDQSATSATLGDGGIYSNVRDLAKWDDGLTSYALLDKQQMSQAWTPVRMPDGSPYYWPGNATDNREGPPKVVDYGFGWFLDAYQGRVREYHDGESVGFRSTIERYVKDNLTIIILSNRTDRSPRALGEGIADLILSSP